MNVQIVFRKKPRELIYYRKPPITYVRPTQAQAELRYLFAIAVKESKNYSVEEVAKLVNGEVIERDGKKFIKMPDGRILMKHMAYVAYKLRGYRSEKKRVYELPEWLKEIAKYYISIPTTQLEKLIIYRGR
jgi:hypothetical protein